MACFPNYNPGNRIQFQVGVADSYNSETIPESSVEIPNVDDTQLVINIANIIKDTVELWNDGNIAPRELTDRESYGVTYASDKVTINFFPAFRQDQVIVVRFQYVF